MNSEKPRVFILYEHGPDLRPFGSAFIRLLRTFTHPEVRDYFDVGAGLQLPEYEVDVVIVDRLWHPHDIELADVKLLVNDVRVRGAKLIYSLDDDYFSIPSSHPSAPKQRHLDVVAYLLECADAVLVTTEHLSSQFGMRNSRIFVIPNHLDERLLVYRSPKEFDPLFTGRTVTIGYMGTFTHDDDFLMVLPALEKIYRRHQSDIRFELLGVISRDTTKSLLQGLPVRFIQPERGEAEYPLFMLWYTSQVQWDIAIAPLQDSVFNRAKSDVKYLDYASIAAAGVFSEVEAYRSTVANAENGLLVPNDVYAWEDALEKLIVDRDMRKRIASVASRELYTKRIVKQNAHEWVKLINNVLSRD